MIILNENEHIYTLEVETLEDSNLDDNTVNNVIVEELNELEDINPFRNFIITNSLP